LPHQLDDLTGLGVAAGFQLGEEQAAIHKDLEAPPAARDQADALDLGLEIPDQVRRQAYGPVCVVSNHAVFNTDIHPT
jgi:hypothetical protein